METILETQELSKSYGSFQAVKKLNLKIGKGSICAFLGQNGAGKSTTIKMLLGMSRPSSGTGKIFGLDINNEEQSVKIRKRTAYVAEDKRLYDYMTVEQILRFTKYFFPLWRHDLEQKLVRMFELPSDRKIKKLSKGMRTKLALTLSLCRGCEFLILDEPTEGLDPLAIENLLEFIVRLAGEGISIFFSSHQIAEVEQIADHVCMIHKGSLLLDADMDTIKENFKYVRIAFAEHEVPVHFSPQGAKSVLRDGSTISFITDKNLDGLLSNPLLLGASHVDVEPISLKDIFLSYVKSN